MRIKNGDNFPSKEYGLLFPGVPGVFDYAEPDGNSRINAAARFSSHRQKRIGTRIYLFSELNTLPASTSVYASPRASRPTVQDSRPG